MALAKILFADPSKCTGCRACELVCSFVNKGVFNPARSNITVITDEKNGVFIPIVCQQCDPAPCMESCPTGALYRNEQTWAVEVDKDKCIGCKLCVMACPLGAIKIDPSTGTSTKCNLCGGEPACVNYCRVKAILYIPEEQAYYLRAREKAESLIRIYKVAVGEAHV